VNEYQYEPIRGLPEQLPGGETIIWQGEPQWSGLARRVFHLRGLGLYFTLLIALHAGSQLLGGEPASAVLSGLGWQLCLGGAALGILAVMARAYARTTVYTLTNRRIVLRFGVAVPMMINLPLDQMESAGLRSCGDGTGDIAIQLKPGSKLSYWAMWPNARPWHWAPVEPMLRAVPEPERVAGLLAEAAMAAEPAPGQAEAPTALRGQRPSSQPGRPRPVAEFPSAAMAAK
jgi:hypothetical protein